MATYTTNASAGDLRSGSGRPGAFDRGVSHVSLIPVRGDTPEMEALREAGDWSPPALADLEEALDRAMAAAPAGAVVTADLWDLERLRGCPRCFNERRLRLATVNRTGRPTPRPRCPCHRG